MPRYRRSGSGLGNAIFLGILGGIIGANILAEKSRPTAPQYNNSGEIGTGCTVAIILFLMLACIVFVSIVNTF